MIHSLSSAINFLTRVDNYHRARTSNQQQWSRFTLSTAVVLLAAACLQVGADVDVMASQNVDSATASEISERPNIIVFLVDDLGWQDSSVAFSGRETEFQSHFRTPNLKRLADRGVRFVNAYSHCVCSPTRTSIMTGLNPARHHVTNWTLYAGKDQSGKTERLAAPRKWDTNGLQPDRQTLAKQLQTAGYRTIHCGKAHWGAIGTPGSDPVNLGFDVNIAGHSAGGPGSYQGMKNFGNHEDGKHKLPWGVPGLEKYHGTDTHLTDALSTEACIAVESAIDDGKNFFLYMAPYAVHAPIQSQPRFVENYRGKNYSGSLTKIPEAEAKYASMVEGYDAALGEILKTITDRNVADKTIILFMSDNGGLTVHSRGTTPRGTGKNTHCWPLREGKGSAYEGGTRVPLVISWATPDSGSKLQKSIPVRKGETSNAHVICEDVYPTVCRWAGIELDDDRIEALDGIDITRFAGDLNETNASMRKLLFHYPHVWGPRGDGYQPHSALRLENWKVIYFYDSRVWELYDLDKDVGEANDLATAEPTQLQRMKSLLIQQLAEKDAQYPFNFKTGRAETPVQ